VVASANAAGLISSPLEKGAEKKIEIDAEQQGDIS
jgi:hypothetical protein